MVNLESIQFKWMDRRKQLELELEIDGSDEQACQQAMVDLIANRFGESE